MLAEHEITKLATLVSDMAHRMGVETAVEHELEEIKHDVAPDTVLEEIEKKVAQ